MPDGRGRAARPARPSRPALKRVAGVGSEPPAPKTTLVVKTVGQLDRREGVVRSVAAAVARAVPGNRSFCDEVVTAFAEAFNNIAIHGYRGREPGPVEVEILASGDEVTVILRDW